MRLTPTNLALLALACIFILTPLIAIGFIAIRVLAFVCVVIKAHDTSRRSA